MEEEEIKIMTKQLTRSFTGGVCEKKYQCRTDGGCSHMCPPADGLKYICKSGQCKQPSQERDNIMELSTVFLFQVHVE